MKCYIYLAAILLSVGLFGCKPKTTTVTGQIFIVTRGADNVKLGAVEVLLIEKTHVTDFLQKRQPVVELELASRQQALADAKRNVENARADYDLFEANKPDLWRNGHNNSFLLNSFFKTYPDYDTIKSQVTKLWQQSDALFKQSKQMQQQAEANGYVPTGANFDRYIAINNSAFQLHEKAGSILETMNDFVKQVETAKKHNLDTAESSEVEAERISQNSPTVEDYLLSFSPNIAQKTLTDADGKFSFAYPRSKSFTIFATAQRAVADKTEKYYWLVNAPSNAETAQVFLSNNNLAFVDPDSYFTLKPKSAR